MSLGTRLRHRREELALSQRELARLVHTRQATISDLERGTLRNPGIDIVRRLAKVLGITADYLIGMYEDEDSEREPNGVALDDASAHAGSDGATGTARRPLSQS